MTKSDFDRWKAEPVTVAFFQSLEAELRELEQALLDGRAMGPTTDEIAATYTAWTSERKGRLASLEHRPEWAREDGES
jgi:hypothetical protein